jgi:hypothetical protein
MSTLVITTFSEDSYYLYGKKLIETWPVVKKILVHLAGNDKYEGQGFNTFSGKKILQN